MSTAMTPALTTVEPYDCVTYESAKAVAVEAIGRRLGEIAKTPEGRDRVGMVANAIARTVGEGLGGSQYEHWQKITNIQMIAAAVTVYETGLSPVGAVKELYLFPEGGVLQVRLSPAGLVKLAGRSGQIVRPAVVRDGDLFEYEIGVEGPRLRHRPVAFSEAPIVGAYVAVYRAADNALLRVVTMSPADIAVCKSKSKMKEKGPWKDFFEQMAIKSVLHKALSSGAITFDEGLTHALAAVPIGAYDGDADEMDLDAPTVRQVVAPDAPRSFQRPPAPPVEETADPVSGEQG